MARGSIVGGEHADRLVGPVELAREALGERERRLACGRGVGEDLVVDVGHVAHERDLVAGLDEPAPEHVDDHRAAQVADVRRGLDGRAAQVNADMPGGDRLEGPHPPGACVVQHEPHSGDLTDQVPGLSQRNVGCG